MWTRVTVGQNSGTTGKEVNGGKEKMRTGLRRFLSAILMIFVLAVSASAATADDMGRKVGARDNAKKAQEKANKAIDKVDAADKKAGKARDEADKAKGEGKAKAVDDAKQAAKDAKKARDGAKRARDEAKKARDGAKKARDEAKKARDKAKKARDKAKKAKDGAKKAGDKAKKAKDGAKKSGGEAKSIKDKADEAKDRVDKARDEADKARDKADKAEEEYDRAKDEADDAIDKANNTKEGTKEHEEAVKEAEKAKEKAKKARKKARKARKKAKKAEKKADRQAALVQRSIRYEVVVRVFTPGAPECPHGEVPLNGVGVDITVQLSYRCSACSPIWTRLTVGQNSGTTGTEELERVNEAGGRETYQEEGRFTATGGTDTPNTGDDEYLDTALASESNMRNRFSWTIRVTLNCPDDHPNPQPLRTVSLGPSSVTGSGTTADPYVIHVDARLRCSCAAQDKRVGMLMPGQMDQGTVVATVAVREEEKVQVSQQVSAQVVTTVTVNEEPQDIERLDEDIPVSPGDVVQLINAVGGVLGYLAFIPEEEEAPPPGATPVVECPAGRPVVVSVPGNYTDTPIEDMGVIMTPVETALTTGTETTPSVTATPTGEAPAVALGTGPERATGVTPPKGLEPILATDDTVVVAGNLDNSAIGTNEVTVIDRRTWKILGETQVDTWRLAGASLNPPVVNKDEQTDLRLNIFGPPDLLVTVTATAGKGLTPRQLTATAPLGVLQSQGLGSFTATRSGQHSVSVKASPVVKGGGPAMGLPAWR